RRGQRQPQPPRLRQDGFERRCDSLPFEMPMRWMRWSGGVPRLRRAVEEYAWQMRDALWTCHLGDSPQQIPFGLRKRFRERRHSRLALHERAPHEVRLLREEIRIPARLEIGTRTH